MEERMEITAEELEQLAPGSFQVYDIRSALEIDHGGIPGSVATSTEKLTENPPESKAQKLVICCSRGQFSLELAHQLQEQGYDAVSLKGGYRSWLLHEMKKQQADELCDQVETSLRKKFRKQIWCNFTKAINRYELVKEGDRIAVCISGGKDSMLMAKLFQELKRHNKFDFDVKFLVMDPGYSPENRQVIEENARKLKIPITVFESDIFESVYHIEKSPCYLCARMRRGHLYHYAQELGCNKIALGHHFNDVIETTVMGMFYGAQLQAMLPKLHSDNFEGMELIRPMYCIHEDDIIRWKNAHELEFIQCACRFTENCTMCDNGGGGSKRQEVKVLLKRLKKDSPDIEKSIFNSIHAVCLDTMPGWKSGGQEHSFLEHYNDDK